jgi:phospholipase C
MQIANQSKSKVWVGLYDITDKACKTPLGGSRQAVDAGATLNYDHSAKPKTQIVFWRDQTKNDGHVSTSCFAGPKTIFTDAPATLIQEDDDKFYVCNHVIDSTHPVTAMDKIEHVVVLMMENRSLDNLAGWLYDGERPLRNIPKKDLPTFDGLQSTDGQPGVDSRYWNTLVAADHDKPTAKKVYPHNCGDGQWAADLNTPSPGPVEVVGGFLRGIFGTDKPAAAAPANMYGFLEDYRGHLTHSLKKSSAELDALAEQIMACYTPAQVPIFSALARGFAISDRWFCSAPCQTWPNRSFVHTGSSFGRLNNMEKVDDEGEHTRPWKNKPSNAPYIDQPRIFDVFEAQGVRTRVYNDSRLPALAHLQFGLSSWRWDAQLLTDLDDISLHPNYIFLEPQMFFQLGWVPQDYHPPYLIVQGDVTLRRVYTLLSESGLWHKTLLIITFDESGNCYDHVPPPKAIRPPASNTPQFPASQIGTLNPFDMYGPRIPTVLVSPYVDKSVVFRSEKAPLQGGITPEFDHCAVLASLRDWVFAGRVLPTDPKTAAVLGNNARVVAAPTIWPVLDGRRRDMPDIDILVNGLAEAVDADDFIPADFFGSENLNQDLELV